MRYVITFILILFGLGQLKAQEKISREIIDKLVLHLDTLRDVNISIGDGYVYKKFLFFKIKRGVINDFTSYDSKCTVFKRQSMYCFSDDYCIENAYYYLKDTLIFFRETKSKVDKDKRKILYKISFYLIDSKFEFILIDGEIKNREMKKKLKILTQNIYNK